MVFASSVFLFIFFPLFLLMYYLFNGRIKLQNAVVFIMSLIFYAWGGIASLILILISICVNWVLGIAVDSSEGRRKKLFMILAVVYNLGILGYYKYFNFVISNILTLSRHTQLISGLPKISLPIGISFFTFQILSYVVDLYLGKVQVQKNIINLGLYVMLFPQLIAGPIVRYSDIEAEISNRSYSADDIRNGLIRFIVGLAKKVIIANTLGELSANIFAGDGYGNVVISWIGALAYTLQIYYDFSGYSDMSIGIGRMIGFHFDENFNYPYISGSVKEFWRRWHISLSSWFRDYVYIPLGGSRKGTFKTYRNLAIIFFLTGLWHGADWTFIIWGLWHGIFLIIERIAGDVFNKIPKVIRHIYTLLVVIIGWIFFNAESLSAAINYFRAMLGMNVKTNLHLLWQFVDTRYILCMILGIIFAFPIKNVLDQKPVVKHFKQNIVLTDITFIVFYIIIISFMMGSGFNPFIYFQF